MPRLNVENLSPGTTFPERFKYLRALNHVTREQVAKAMDVSVSLIDGYTIGERSPSRKMQAKLADYFDVSIEYLMGRSLTKDLTIYTDFIEQYSLEESSFLVQFRESSHKTQEIIKGIMSGALKAQEK